ncbi:uncharacterized protein LOC121874392 isoform X2 [Homarus americanus]|nr:uncharacterized protein LOC121874392 isoform X2 [Homarus americanus]
MISMGKIAHEVREMYLSKFKQVSPYVCNAMSPRVVLLRLNSKMIDKYTRQDSGKNDSLLSDDDEDWFTAVNDNWDMSLLEPIIQISSEANSQQGPKGKREGYARGKRGRLALNINRRKSPVQEEIQVKQERPDSPDLGVPNDTMTILTNVAPYNPAVTMLQVPSAVLPMYVSSSQPSSKTLGKGNINITTDHNALPHTGHPPSYGNGVIETNIKQEVTDTEVIIMPFEAAPHGVRPQDAPSKDTLSSVPSPPPKALNPPNKRKKNSSQGKTKKGTAATSDKDPSGHESLRELTTLLVELNNKNTVCDEKIQLFKDEYEKKVSVIEAEKKSNEKEIECVLSLIQNWKEGSKTKAPAPPTTNKRSRKSAR